MLITERETGDEVCLRTLARAERDADQKDRSLCVVHACRGQETERIQSMLARSRGFVQHWAYAYRGRGLDAVHPPTHQGRPPRPPCAPRSPRCKRSCSSPA